MPTPVGHSIAGYICFKLVGKYKLTASKWKTFLVVILFANLPDFDYLPGFIMGEPHRFHHGISHSIGLALLFAIIISLLLKVKNHRMSLHYFTIPFTVYFSHIILDYFAKDTSVPFGEMLLWPFTKEYFISPISIFTDIHKADPSSIFIQSLFNLHNLWAMGVEIVLLLPILWLVSVYQ